MDSPGLLASAVQGGAGFRPYRAEMQTLAAAAPGEQDLWAREGWGPGLAAGLKLGERQSLRAWSCEQTGMTPQTQHSTHHLCLLGSSAGESTTLPLTTPTIPCLPGWMLQDPPTPSQGI